MIISSSFGNQVVNVDTASLSNPMNSVLGLNENLQKKEKRHQHRSAGFSASSASNDPPVASLKENKKTIKQTVLLKTTELKSF